MMNIAINGLGRIGKNFLRGILLDPQASDAINIVAINLGPGNKEHAAHLFTYDSLMGQFPGQVHLDGNSLVINGKKILLLHELDPLALPWKSLNIDWVVDCSGKFTQRAGAQRHIDAGARAVLISAPSKDADVTIIPGVNDAMFDSQQDKIVSLGSCTTNALLPILKVLQEELDFQQGFMTTVHAYTNSQGLLDIDAKDIRRARSATLNIIPTTTGASQAVMQVIPNLKGRLEGVALRVPVAIVSLLDVTFLSDRMLTVDAVNQAFYKAATSNLQGIVGFSKEPLVSSDFRGTNFSVVIDSLLTQSIGKMAKVFGWYDNEWGYSQRLKDFLKKKQ